MAPDYHYHPGGELGGALVFLLVVELWEQEPIVRGLYRQVSNADTVLPSRTRRGEFLYYASGSATAEDELIAKLRLHFGKGSRAAVADRDGQNAGLFRGLISASFFDGHLEVMAPRVCQALTETKPRNLDVTLTGDDAALSWDAPSNTTAVDGLSGYRILRGVDGETPSVYIAEAGLQTTWSDDDLDPGDYQWVVQALFDGYASPDSNTVRGTVPETGLAVGTPRSSAVVEGETAVATLSVTGTDSSAEELTWSISGGADNAQFTLSAGGMLSFAAVKDFEAPDDAGGDGTYELSVQVSERSDDATAEISVSLSNLNEAPTADAGEDQSGIEEGATVTLNGAGEDPDAGDTLEYAWTQTGERTVALSSPSEAGTTFTAPTELTEEAVLTFALRVTDAGDLSAEDTVTVTVAGGQAGPEDVTPTSFAVVEGATAVGTVTATDDDTRAADLTWSIAGGADSAHFTLSPGRRARIHSSEGLRGAGRRRRRRNVRPERTGQRRYRGCCREHQRGAVES